MTVSADDWKKTTEDRSRPGDYARRARFYDVEYRTDRDQQLLRALVTDQVASILEIPCGVGRNVDWLAGTGCAVVCADIEPLMIERLRKRVATLRAEKRVSALTADIRSLDLGRRFDLILVPQEAFQLLVEPAEAVEALRRLRAHLTPGGTLLVDLHAFTADPFGRETLPDYFDPALSDGKEIPEWKRAIEGGGYLTRARVQWQEGPTVRVEYMYTLDDKDHTTESWRSEIRLRRYSPEMFSEMAAEVGLHVVRVMRNYAGDLHTPCAARAITLLQSRPSSSGES